MGVQIPGVPSTQAVAQAASTALQPLINRLDVLTRAVLLSAGLTPEAADSYDLRGLPIRGTGTLTADGTVTVNMLTQPIHRTAIGLVVLNTGGGDLTVQPVTVDDTTKAIKDTMPGGIPLNPAGGQFQPPGLCDGFVLTSAAGTTYLWYAY